MGKPTIREILTDFDITDPKHELLAERVEAVLRLNRPARELLGLPPSADERCAACKDMPWPCPTIRALEGEQP